MDMQIRAISEKHNVKIAIVDITEGLIEIAKLQNTNPLSIMALGRTIIDNNLLSLSIKDGSKMSSHINGMGLCGSIIAEFQNNNFRGYVQNPNFDVSNINKEKESPLAQVVGKQGFLQVTVYPENNDSYTSKVELISGEINMDFMYYLQQSDQIYSLISSTVNVNECNEIKKACGILIQLLPGYQDEDIDFIEEKIGSLEHLINTLEKTTNYESLIKDICEDAKVLSVGELHFACSCNLEKAIDTVKLLDKSELEKIKEQGEVVEIVCDFCKKQYEVTPNQINQ